MSTHSVLSPSGSDTWATCVGALAAGKHLPKSPDSPASLLGSAKHAISELCLTNPTMQQPSQMVGQTWHLSKDKALERTPSEGCYTFLIDDDFADHCNVYVDYVNSRPGTKVFESFVSTSHIFGVPNQGGSIDAKCLNAAERQIEIIDAKFGFIPVGAKKRQLRIYGTAAVELHDLEGEWDTVRCTIVQPQDFSEQVKSYVYTRAELEAFVQEIRPIAQKAWALYQNPPTDLLQYLTPTDEGCHWCPVATAGCAARNAKIISMFDDCTQPVAGIPTVDTVLMSDAELARIYPMLPDISEWVSQIAAEADRRAMAGTKIPGHKLIYGRRGARRWVEGSDESVQNTLSVALGEADMFQPRKLLSPTAVEDALKKAKAKGIYDSVKLFVTSAEPRLKLVPDSTKGDAVSVGGGFEDITK